MKKCSKCGKQKKVSLFSKDPSRPDRLHPYCKECRKQTGKVWYERNILRKKEYDKLYYLKNKEFILEKRKKEYWKDPEKAREESKARYIPKSKIGKCPLCSKTGRLYNDHCHISGLDRRMICNKCNLMLGHAEDRITVLFKSILYLLLHRMRSWFYVKI